MISVVISAQPELNKSLNEVGISIDLLKDKSADLLFPEEFRTAEDYYLNALNIAGIEGPMEDINDQLAESRSIIAQMENDIDRRYNYTRNVLAARENALIVNADKHAEKYWSEAEIELKNLVDELEDSSSETSEAVLIDKYVLAKTYAEKAEYLINDWKPLINADLALGNLLAPNSYDKGMEKFSSLMTEISGGESYSEIENRISEAGTIFNLCADNASKYSAEFNDVLAVRSEAQSFRADDYSVENWLNGEEALKNSASNFENGDIEDARESAHEAVQFYNLSKKVALENKVLFNAKRALEKAKDDEVYDYAPETYKQGVYLYELSSSELARNNIDMDKAQTYADRAEVKLNEAIKIAEIVESVDDDELTWEDLILKWGVLHSDEYYKPSFKKDGNINTETEDKFDDPAIFQNSGNMDTVNDPRQRADDDEREVDQDIEDMFTDDEAIIYYDRDSLIISMVGVDYKPCRIDLESRCKELLNRAALVIKRYPKAKVKIAVHTDNIGPKSYNKNLAAQRAEKIYNYLVQQSRIRADRLSFAAYGEEKPIAENLTKEGRDKNRRVDVILIVGI